MATLGQQLFTFAVGGDVICTLLCHQSKEATAAERIIPGGAPENLSATAAAKSSDEGLIFALKTLQQILNVIQTLSLEENFFNLLGKDEPLQVAVILTQSSV